MKGRLEVAGSVMEFRLDLRVLCLTKNDSKTH